MATTTNFASTPKVNGAQTAVTTYAVSLPTAAAAGDLIIGAIGINKSAGSVPTCAVTGTGGPYGSPTLHADNVATSISGAVHSIVATGGEQTFTWTWTTAQVASATIAAYPGYTAGTATENTYTETADASAPFTTDVPAVTVGNNGGLAWTFLTIDTATSWDTTAPTCDTGFTVKDVAYIRTSTGVANDTGVAFAEKDGLGSSTSSGLITWTFPASDQVWAAAVPLTGAGAATISASAALASASSVAATEAPPPLVELRPTSTTDAGTPAFTIGGGAASLHDALADELTTTYITGTGA